jgi:hypothetical protein
MDIRHLRSFVGLAEDGKFTSAARRLNVVQFGLSVAIKEMEEELGARSSLLRKTLWLRSVPRNISWPDNEVQRWRP